MDKPHIGANPTSHRDFHLDKWTQLNVSQARAENGHQNHGQLGSLHY